MFYVNSQLICVFYCDFRCLTENDLNKPTQILSSLFPQTAPINNTEEEKARAKEKKEKEEEKEEQKKAWKRMKYG